MLVLVRSGAAAGLVAGDSVGAEGLTRLMAGAGPVVASFLTFGLFWGSWAVMLFYIQRTYSLNDAQLGVLLAVAVAVAGGVECVHRASG